MKLDEQKQILENVLLMMSYDPSKTLSEQGSADINIDRINTQQLQQAPEEEPVKLRPGEVKLKNEYLQVPGHFPIATPFDGYIYIPNESVYSLFSGNENLTKMYNYTDVQKKPTEEQLKNIMKPGTLKVFTVPTGEKYYFIPLLGKEFGDLKYGGYRTVSGVQYASPEVIDTRTSYQKFIDDYGLPLQLVGSLLIAVLGTIATEGLGAPASWAMFFEIVGEIGLNLPIALRELERGENIGASMSFIFAMLPLMKNVAGLGNISNTMANNLSKKLAEANIQTESQLAEFIKTLSKEEQLAMNVVLKQDPNNLAKITKETLNTQILDFLKLNRKDLLGKLPLTSREWAKSLGVDLITILPLMAYKIKYGEGLKPEEARKLNGFILSFPKESQTQVVTALVDNPELIEQALSNPEETKKYIENLPKPKFDTGVEMTQQQADSAGVAAVEYVFSNLDSILGPEPENN